MAKKPRIRNRLTSKITMDTETLNHLMTLSAANKALIDGLKAAVYFLDKVEEISE